MAGRKIASNKRMIKPATKLISDLLITSIIYLKNSKLRT
jgi:hypothetical protein